MTGLVNPGDTKSYSTDLLKWAQNAGFSAAVQDRLTAMLAFMTLALLRKHKSGVPFECYPDPSDPAGKLNVLHYQSDNGSWYCFCLASDPSKTSSPLKFDVKESDPQGSTRKPGKLIVQLNSGMSFNQVLSSLP